MRKIALSIAILGTTLLSLLCTVPAHAQATTWVSGVGDDANPCSRTAPCKTFAGSISKTAAGGEINCLDPGGFGAVTITKAVTTHATELGRRACLCRVPASPLPLAHRMWSLCADWISKGSAPGSWESSSTLVARCTSRTARSGTSGAVTRRVFGSTQAALRKSMSATPSLPTTEPARPAAES